MLLCRVVGRAVATHSHSSLDGFSMLLCQQEDSAGVPTGEPPFVAIDLFGAGMHQRVFVSTDEERQSSSSCAFLEKASKGAEIVA